MALLLAALLRGPNLATPPQYPRNTPGDNGDTVTDWPENPSGTASPGSRLW